MPSPKASPAYANETRTHRSVEPGATASGAFTAAFRSGSVAAGPPCFSAPGDCGLTTSDLVQSGAIPGKEHRLELLEEAWQQGGRAKWQYPVVPAVTGFSTDTALGMQLVGSILNLDALRLRSLAVLLLAAEDRGRALDLFLAMGAPAPPKLTCTDPHNFDVTMYYRTGLALSRKLFAPAEVRNGKRLDFLLDIIRGVTTPAQAPPRSKC